MVPMKKTKEEEIFATDNSNKDDVDGGISHILIWMHWRMRMINKATKLKDINSRDLKEALHDFQAVAIEQT